MNNHDESEYEGWVWGLAMMAVAAFFMIFMVLGAIGGVIWMLVKALS